MKDNNFNTSRIIFLFLIAISGPATLFSQVTNLNLSSGVDSYSTLRNMFTPSDINNAVNTDLDFEHRLNKDLKLFIKYFIGDHEFTLKSDIDLHNRILYAQIELHEGIKSYQYERSKIDSLYLLVDKKLAPISKYVYSLKEDIYAKVIHQGKFDLVNGYHMEVTKGFYNPLIDSAPKERKLVTKEIGYLIDSGHWYRIPLKKKSLLQFIKKHYQKSVNKDKILKRDYINTLINFNY